jgi:UDP-N-acetylmuramyl pentapeptide phosphotransferase/UDP-N-acetylglucosamine-1-phosphate transferase
VIAQPGALIGRLLVGAVAAGAARAVYAQLRRRTSGRTSRWDRINHRGESVTLLEGPAVVVGTALALALAPRVSTRLRAAGVLAAVGCGTLGAYDDLAGSGDARGLRGHLRALRSGEVTTGAVKVLGIGTVGVLTAALAGPPTATPPQRSWAYGHDTPSRRSRKPMIVALGAVSDVVLGGAVVASLANLVNLFDLRPGRAIKVGVLLGAPATLQPGPTGTIVAAPIGAALAVLPEDLGERAMLGDCGANALGAVIGVAVLARYGRVGRFAHLAAATALTLASEKVSFTRVIERTPILRRLDMWGRRPTAPT